LMGREFQGWPSRAKSGATTSSVAASRMRCLIVWSNVEASAPASACRRRRLGDGIDVACPKNERPRVMGDDGARCIDKLIDRAGAAC
jgi:hypothetical protein